MPRRGFVFAAFDPTWMFWHVSSLTGGCSERLGAFWFFFKKLSVMMLAFFAGNIIVLYEYVFLRKIWTRLDLLSIPQSGGKMSKRLGGSIIGCQAQASSWHLNGFHFCWGEINLGDTPEEGHSRRSWRRALVRINNNSTCIHLDAMTWCFAPPAIEYITRRKPRTTCYTVSLLGVQYGRVSIGY